MAGDSAGAQGITAGAEGPMAGAQGTTAQAEAGGGLRRPLRLGLCMCVPPEKEAVPRRLGLPPQYWEKPLSATVEAAMQILQQKVSGDAPQVLGVFDSSFMELALSSSPKDYQLHTLPAGGALPAGTTPPTAPVDLWLLLPPQVHIAYLRALSRKRPRDPAANETGGPPPGAGGAPPGAFASPQRPPGRPAPAGPGDAAGGAQASTSGQGAGAGTGAGAGEEVEGRQGGGGDGGCVVAAGQNSQLQHDILRRLMEPMPPRQLARLMGCSRDCRAVGVKLWGEVQAQAVLTEPSHTIPRYASSVRVTWGAAPALFRALAAAPPPPAPTPPRSHLLTLDLSAAGLQPQQCPALFRLSALQSLDASNQGEALDRALQTHRPLHSFMPRMRRLTLRNCGSSSLGVEYNFPHVTHLDLCDTSRRGGSSCLYVAQRLTRLACLRVEGCAHLDSSVLNVTGLSRLTELRLGGRHSLTDACGRHLAVMTRLQVLTLPGAKLGVEGLWHLADLTALVHLDVSSTLQTDVGMQHLRKMTALTHLAVANNQLTAAGMAHLTGLTQLRELDVHGNSLRSEGAGKLSHLAAALLSLDISSNQLGDAGARRVSHLAGLQHLSIGGNSMRRPGLAHVCAALTALTSLRLQGNHPDLAARHLTELAALSASLRDVQLQATQLAGTRHLSRLTRLTRLDLTIEGLHAQEELPLGTLCMLVKLRVQGPLPGAALQALSTVASLQEVCLRDATSLACLQPLTQIKALDLSNNRVAGQDMQHLSGLTQLRELYLGSTGLMLPAACSQLSSLCGLRLLDFSCNPHAHAADSAQDQARASMAHLVHCRRLQALFLYKTDLYRAFHSAAIQQQLQDALPQLCVLDKECVQRGEGVLL